MFFHKRTGTGSADLVHLKIHNFTVLDADVFAVLPADLKDSIRLRHPVRSALCLRGDLIPHGIGTDALADTLGSRNASGSLERDTDVASLGRLTDFIHVAEGWEEAVAHALDQYASAIVVPEAGNMLHALERAREDKLGKAVVLTASIAGDPATEPGTESEESSAENAGAAPQSGNALAALVTANPDAENPAQAEAVVRTVRLLLADVAAAGTADEAQAKEILDIDMDGEDITVAFNPSYLVDGLSAISEPFVRMKMTTAVKPVEFNGQQEADSDESMDYRYLLVPMRFNN